MSKLGVRSLRSSQTWKDATELGQNLPNHRRDETNGRRQAPAESLLALARDRPGPSLGLSWQGRAEGREEWQSGWYCAAEKSSMSSPRS